MTEINDLQSLLHSYEADVEAVEELDCFDPAFDEALRSLQARQLLLETTLAAEARRCEARLMELRVLIAEAGQES